jgi:prepilin-type N-terminal cleavage/methylation domain-containing protein
LNPINMYLHRQSGFTLIEVIIASAIIVTGIVALSEGYTQYVKYALANEKNIQAAYLAEEALEVVTYFRDQQWSSVRTLSTTTPLYIAWNNTTWQTTTTPQYVDGIFLRSVSVTDVYRDANDHIAASGSFDPNTKFITANVSYKQGEATTTKTLSTYLTNIYGE